MKNTNKQVEKKKLYIRWYVMFRNSQEKNRQKKGHVLLPC